MYSNRNKPLKRIHVADINANEDRLGYFSHAVYKVCKKTKPDTWFKKLLWTFSNSKINSHPSELEAIASDFYRFILGENRAAKSRVLVDEEKPDKHSGTYQGIMSQLNPHGYDSVIEIWDDYEIKKKKLSPAKIKKRKIIGLGYEEIQERRQYIYNSLMTPEAGIWEVLLASYVLDEGDAGQLYNYGLNRNKEVSRIDYDISLLGVKRKFFTHDVNLKHNTIHDYDMEWYVNRGLQLTGNSLKRFFQCQIRTLLLRSAITPIVNRHSESDALRKEINNHLNGLIVPLKCLLVNSSKFRNYMIKEFTFEAIEDDLKRYFRSEDKHCPPLFISLMDEFKQKIVELKAHCYSTECDNAYTALKDAVEDFKQHGVKISKKRKKGEEVVILAGQLSNLLSDSQENIDKLNDLKMTLHIQDAILKKHAGIRKILGVVRAIAEYVKLPLKGKLLFWAQTISEQKLSAVEKKLDYFQKALNCRPNGG